MSRWYQVFDDERVNVVTRTAARRHVTAVVLLGGVSAALVLAIFVQGLSPCPVITVLAGLWGWAGIALLRSWATLRSQVWCIKVSDREVVGYDYRRHRLRIDWIDARSVELSGRGLSIQSVSDEVIQVPVRFPDYTELCHAVLAYAEFYMITVLVDGRELASLTAREVFPFLDTLEKGEGS